MTIRQVLMAMSADELAQAAVSAASSALAAPAGTLHGPLARSIVEAIEDERLTRGLAPIAWFQQAAREVAHYFPAPAGPQPIHLSLDGTPPADIQRTAELLSRAARLAAKQGEDSIGGILGGLALALDAQLPQAPSRVDPRAN